MNNFYYDTNQLVEDENKLRLAKAIRQKLFTKRIYIFFARVDRNVRFANILA
jgi:hypothetical protein